MPLAPPWNHTLPSLSCVTPHCELLGPVGSFSRPPGVQRSLNALTVLYSQLSIAQKRLDCCDSMLPARPKLFVKSSFLSATPSPFVSVYFQISSAFVSMVR